MIYFIFIVITIMLRWSLAKSAGHFWQPEEFEDVANTDFIIIKHLQNPGHLLLNSLSIYNKDITPKMCGRTARIREGVLASITLLSRATRSSTLAHDNHTSARGPIPGIDV